MGKLFWSIVGVVIAVGAVAGLWIGANLLFTQVTTNFKRFSALTGAVIGFVFFALIDGNNLITGIAERPPTFEFGSLHVYAFWPVAGAAILAATGYALSLFDDRPRRLGVAVGGALAAAVILAFTLKTKNLLSMRTNPMIGWTAAVTIVGAGLAVLRKRDVVKGALTGAFIGWLIGSFGGALNGVADNRVETILAFVVAAVLIGARLGLSENPDVVGRANIDNKSRSWLFVGPAFLFISVMLIIPTIQTVILSTKSNKPIEPGSSVYSGVGLDNYQTVFSDSKNFNADRFSALFASSDSTSIFPWGGSAILPWVLFFLAAGILLAVLLGRETGQALNFGGAPILPLVMAATLFAFALFTHLRGTIINNLWWVVAVTVIATSLGLAVAKLADGAKFEAVAKSFVFMPMAISMVGASIIWRLMMYQARDASKNQTGLLNAVWVWLGKTTTSQPGKVIIGVIFLAAALALIYAAVRALSSSPAAGGLYSVIAIIPLWVSYRTFTTGIGGYIGGDGAFRANPINFVQGQPFNSFWLMVILIWIQTGFAMVILSAAIKGVPGDYIEAAQIDGATDGQIFWRITIPSVLPTIGVVATTIMVNVMKVYDIVKVTTNGQFDSQVLANAMVQEAFLFSNPGTGAALAVVLFVGVLPVMIYNIYNLTKEA